jgi:hypothetical protein
LDRFASGVRAFAVLLFVGSAGCFDTMPCPDGLVSSPSGCVPEDAGAMGDGCVLLTFYLDGDGDEHGDPAATMMACDAPDGYVAAGDDCDDDSSAQHPGLTETCDGLDNDCNDSVDEGVLLTFYPDADVDGHGILGATMMACTAPEGFAPASDDCDDTSDVRFPGNTEICDAIDNDCDAPMVDETFACVRDASTACLTSCGSMGTGMCTASCTAPTTCTPPAETCGASAGEDDDCDGFVDEGAQSVSLPIALGAVGNRVVVVPTDEGYVAFMARTGGLFARRFDEAGVMIAGETLIDANATANFDAFVVGSRILVGWMTGDQLVGVVLTSVLGPSTPAVNLYTLDGFEGQLRVGVSDTTAMFLFHNGNLGSIDGIRRAWPTLTGTAAVERATMTAANDFDAAFAPSGALIAARAGTAVRVGHYSSSGARSSVSDLGDASPESFPSVHYTAEHGGVMMIAWFADPASTASDGVRMQTYSVAVSGTFAPLENSTLLLGGVPASGRPIELAYTGGRFAASIFRTTAAPASDWRLIEVNAMGPPVVRTTMIESADQNAVAAIAAEGTDGVVFVAATRATGITRAHLRGCP